MYASASFAAGHTNTCPAPAFILVGACARGGTRTHTPLTEQVFLRDRRLPFRHPGPTQDRRPPYTAMRMTKPALARRRAGSVTVLVAASLLGSACAQLTRATGLSSPGGNPTPSTAIVLSIPSDSIYFVDPQSGRAQAVVTGLIDLQAGYATWSNGHSAIAYGDAGIRILDPKKLTSEAIVAAGTVSMPAFSPKGKAIVFGDGTHMWIMSASAPAPAPTTVAPVALPDTLGPAAFDWVGAKRIIFQGNLLDCSNPEGCLATSTSDIWTIRSNGEELTQMTSTGDASDPKWAPGGGHFLFVRTSSVQGFGSQLWVAKADGTSPHQVTGAKNVVAADWSVDGKQLVVIRSNPSTSTLQIWIGSADGSHLHQVGEPIPGTDATVDW